ncbi:MAG: hypothetical protein AAFV37_05130 [Pseudomonadota bacterium]
MLIQQLNSRIHAIKAPSLALACMLALAACVTPNTEQPTLSDPDLPSLDNAVEGYAYPEPLSGEQIETLVQDTIVPPRALRVQIATSILMMESQRPYAPSFFPITEGDEAETLVLMDTGTLGLDNRYKARAFVSVTTSLIRNNPIFLEHGVQNEASIFDMLKIWGFERLVVTNGDDFSHVFEIN